MAQYQDRQGSLTAAQFLHSGSMAVSSSITLISGSATPCGVESFARRVSDQLRHAGSQHETFTITAQPGEVEVLKRALRDRAALIVHLPVVGWKKRIASPARYMLAARRMRKEVILVLHEWADLDWKRRATYLAYLPLATRILFSSPLVRDQFAADVASKLATKNRGLVPIPPNLERPTILQPTGITTKIAALKTGGKVVIGHFGSIYPRKQSTIVLDIAAELKARGKTVHTLFIGGFISGGSLDPNSAFDARVVQLGLQDDVTVTGYIGPAAEVFAALDACDLFVYAFSEGLTSRRSSVLTCLQSRRPIVVNSPYSDDEFLHHNAFSKALAAGALTLVSPRASASEFATAIINASRDSTYHLDFDQAWSDAVAVF